MNIKVTNPYLKLSEEFYNLETPQPLKNAYLIDLNLELSEEIGLNSLSDSDFLKLTNGEFLLDGAKPFASVYAGHQFGHFVPQLGDGRAINIGTIDGWHLQLKGSGITKYSRDGDGRAVLRSSIREYLVSEAMHGLGIDTTRAISIVGSKHRVYRGEWESGAVVLRASKSWIRVGTFEYFYHKGMYKELAQLIEYTILESYSHLSNREDKIALFFQELVAKSARLVASWQAVGFNHGVLNTDNFSIAGLSIDYGPFAFFDDYNRNYICNHTDRGGRYSFKNQPNIFKWNLSALALTLSKFVDISILKEIIEEFDTIYLDRYLDLISKKLGLEHREKDDYSLIEELLSLMETLEIDYTLFFRTLSYYNKDQEPLLKLALYHNPLKDWLNRYSKRLELNSRDTKSDMLQINPKYVLKNYMLQDAIDLAQRGDFSLVKDLLKIAKNPYIEHEKLERYSKSTPQEYKNRKLSCSS